MNVRGNDNNRSKVCCGFLLGLLLFLLVSACSAAGAPASAGSAAPTAQPTAAAVPAAQSAASAPGVTATEVKIGTSVPLTGPAANYGPISSGVYKAYYNYINDQGGVNGRKINLILMDNGFDPAKSLATAKQMVEQDKVLAMVGVQGTLPNDAIYRYLNENKVPLFGTLTGAVQFNQPKDFPYIFQYQLSYGVEPTFIWKVISQKFPGKKIGVLYENDDFGKNLQQAFDKVADKSLIVSEQPYEASDSDISSQMQALKSAGSDVVVEFVLVKQAILAARFIHDSGWNAPQFISSNAFDPSALQLSADEYKNMMGLVTYPLVTDDSNPQVQTFKQIMSKYSPQVPLGPNAMQAYGAAQLFIEILKRAGNDLTRDHLVQVAESIKDFKDMLVLGSVSISSTDHSPVSCVRLAEMNGTQQVYAGDIMCK